MFANVRSDDGTSHPVEWKTVENARTSKGRIGVQLSGSQGLGRLIHQLGSELPPSRTANSRNSRMSAFDPFLPLADVGHARWQLVKNELITPAVTGEG